LKVVVGLGNPGIEYESTRHNVGFEIIDRLSSAFSVGSFKLEKGRYAETSKGEIGKQTVLLVKPVTYMNDSGKAVLAIKQFYKLALQDFLIIHDDVSLPLGKLRLQKNSGAGGQHGVESIIECLGGEKDFDRLKVGIGPDPGGNLRHHYVLQKFSPTERFILDKIIDVATDAICSWSKDGIERAMNEFNGLDVR
jgi:PTH1 family peptidyl-tRNA hydrolase